ncbi:MAG: DNA topoisomerase IB [Actinomycetota bacterium]|nr:DNA topoisomerase IB [Actinomycetota bacterium]
MAAERATAHGPDDALDPALAARAAGLRYVSSSGPGLRRVRSGRGFRYLGPDGKPIDDPQTLARIRALAIPPAWTDVWISPIPRGHLQATGRDARGRKQYRYHAEWRRVRDETKYDRMIAFGRALPAIRRRVTADLRASGLRRDKVLATVVRLLDTAHARIGNASYAKDNESFGLTTLRDRHVTEAGSGVRLEFTGKGGKLQVIDVRNPALARIVKRCRDLPGYELFQYVDDEGQRRIIESGHVNAYLGEICGETFTAKDFRTWAGSVLTSSALGDVGPPPSRREGVRIVNRTIESVAARLGNTPAICRKCYVHPHVVEAYLDGGLDSTAAVEAPRIRGLRQEEAALLRLLRRMARRTRSA